MRAPAHFLCAAALLVSFAATAAPDPHILRPDGLGPVKIGMTIRDAGRALGAKLQSENPRGDGDCDYYTLGRSQAAFTAYMVENGRITRIDIGYSANPNPYARTPVTTLAGIGIGSTESDIRHAYGRNLKIVPDPYMEDQGNNLTVEDPGHNRGILFETLNGKVIGIRAGIHPSLEYSEGCS